MTRKLVECVPNFSEGRRPEVIDAIAAAIQPVPTVVLLDRHIDASHNRSVLTFVGEPDAVREAAFRAIEKAAELIDLTKHKGVHPRIGATDVVPFIPVRSTTMTECTTLAETLGAQVADRLGIPVYLYEHAARRPERTLLANIRRGEFEALRDEIATREERVPDFGPRRVHPTAGAIAIGARTFLIAFNVNLATQDHALARAIAAKIRESGGGFEGVRALGLRLDEEGGTGGRTDEALPRESPSPPPRDRGIVQVSMNLVDFNKTGLHDVFRRIDALAREHGVEVRNAEVVGLVPAAAVHAAVRDGLKLLKFDREQVLEERLRDLGGLDLGEFLDDLAAPRPAPGGGAAGALAGALAAATGEKVANLTRAKEKFKDLEPEFDALAATLHAARWDLLRLADRDAAAFDGIIAASRLPKATPEQAAARAAAVQAATLEACRAPLAIGEAVLNLVRAAATAGTKGNPHAIADALAAVSMARGALDTAFAMFRVNAPGLEDKASAASLRARFDEIRAEAQRAAGDLEAEFTRRFDASR